MRRTPASRARRAWPLAAALALGLCLCAAGFGLAAGVVPDAVHERLGPPAPHLDPLQRVALGGYLWVRQLALDAPAGSAQAELEFRVEPGENAQAVIERLRQAGIIHDAVLLQAYMRYRGFDRSIEAGRYRVSGGFSIRALAETLQTAHPLQIVFTVPEGWRLEQIADALRGSGLPIAPADFLAAAHTRPPGYSFSEELSEPPSLEGLLFPETYLLDPDVTAVELVLTMLDAFEARVGPELRQGFAQQGLSLLEAVTLASIVEREAVHADERPLIAGVFLNRLRIGMRLDADPTVQYALGAGPDGVWWRRTLTAADLAVDSPYNTYRVTGLPPGPIASPGLSALRSVAAPAASDYLYFRADCDGSGRHRFARTYEEHLANACP